MKKVIIKKTLTWQILMQSYKYIYKNLLTQ